MMGLNAWQTQNKQRRNGISELPQVSENHNGHVPPPHRAWRFGRGQIPRADPIWGTRESWGSMLNDTFEA